MCNVQITTMFNILLLLLSINRLEKVYIDLYRCIFNAIIIDFINPHITFLGYMDYTV